MFLNQRGAEFSFFTPSAPPRPTHSNLSGVGVTTRQTLFLITIRFPLLSIYFCSSAFRLLLPFFARVSVTNNRVLVLVRFFRNCLLHRAPVLQSSKSFTSFPSFTSFTSLFLRP